MEKKKMGRPIKNKIPRNIKLGVQFNSEELELLNSLSKTLGESRTDVLVRGLRLVEKTIKK